MFPEMKVLAVLRKHRGRSGMFALAIVLVLSATGCGPNLKSIADKHVENGLLAAHEKREAIPFLEAGGLFFDTEETAGVDREIVLPMLRQLTEVISTDQWAVLGSKDENRASAILIRLPADSKTVDRMAEVVAQADDKFPGLILQQWGNDWLLIKLIDQQAYEFLKKNDPDIDKQR